MSRQRIVTQIDAEAGRLLAGLVTRDILMRRREGRGVQYYEPAREDRAVARSGKVTKVAHYYLPVNVMTKPVQVREDSPPYGGTS
jgi:hypothetical protein